MKIINHQATVHATGETYRKYPFSVFLTPRRELRLQRGDRLDKVARVVARSWPLDEQQARSVAAFWFALGERLAAGGRKLNRPWTPVELRTAPHRCYVG